MKPTRLCARIGRWTALATLALCGAPAISSPLGAEELRKLTVERLAADPSLSGALPTALAWSPEGRLTFVRPAGEKEPSRLVAVEPASGRETTLLDGSRVLFPEGAGPSAGKPLPLSSAAWIPGTASLLVPASGSAYLVDSRSGAVRTLASGEVVTPEASPDGRRIAFVRGNDLFTVEIATGKETRLTTSGTATVMNGRLDWVYEEELASRSPRAFWWSPDSRTIAYLQLDEARVATFPIVDFLPVRSEVREQRYPKAGFANSIVKVGVVGLHRTGEPGPERLVSFDPDDLYVLPDMAFTPDSRGLAFQVMNREQNTLDLRLLPVPDSPSAALGLPRSVLTERSSSWVNGLLPPHFLKDGKRFLWLSERDGFAHLYVCETANGSCRAVTRGPWLVDAGASFFRQSPALRVDERSGFVYFTATEKDPRERHLYSSRFDGTGLARLTREDGTHRTLVSPDGRYFADLWSSLQSPGRFSIQTQDGTKRHVLADSHKAPILEYERAVSELVEVRAKDETTLFGLLAKPRDLDPSRKYPVIVSVYGGPHGQSVTHSWHAVSPFTHLLASRGFVVFSLDNRGTAARGQAFEAAISRDLGRVELEDQLAGVEYLESLPFVDGDRIGITGWSYGGYMTLFALTNAPSVFRAAVAGAPVVDWSLYDSIYAERYMGTPASNAKGYESSAPLRRAEKLQAALLLVHGTADDNVHMANTVAFIDALTRAGRPYSLLLGPRQAHGFASKEARVARDRAILSHFEAHLGH